VRGWNRQTDKVDKPILYSNALDPRTYVEWLHRNAVRYVLLTRTAPLDWDGGPREAAIVHRFGTVGKLADLAAMAAVERDTGRVETVGRPLHEGLSGALWKAARALTATSLAVSLLPGRSRVKRAADALLGTAGAVALRFAVFHAGKASARDPRATFRRQRAH